MAEYLVPCGLCGESVDAFDRYTYQRVEGWGRKGNAGGSDIVDRQQLEVFAHPRCVDKEKRGRAGQESLLA